MKKKIVCVTGASSGIGEKTALAFAEQGYNILAIARREDRLQKLAKTITQKYHVDVLTIPLDVRERALVESAFSNLPKSWQTIDVLVNNAGLALGRTPIQDGNPDDWDVMIDTNVKGLLYVTKAVVPFFIQRQRGHIINIGSIAGKEMYPNGNVYAMTKHAVVALSDGLRLDLLPHNIRVTTINPGHVKTEFAEVRYKGDKDKVREIYAGFETLMPEDIARAIYFAASQPPHVNINDMIIMPSAQASAITIKKK